MKNVFIGLSILFNSILVVALPMDSMKEFFGARSQEAQFSFETQFFIPTSKGTPTDKLVKSEFKPYVKYMLGQMRRTVNNAAAIYPKYEVTLNKFEKANESYNRVYVQLTGKGVFNLGLKEYTFLIPFFVGDIHKKAKDLCNAEESVDDSIFWYHWAPQKEGCPLVAQTDYAVVTAPITYLPSTQKTYPEYDRLFRQGPQGGLRMTVFFGMEKYEETDWNPTTNEKDWGAISYRQQKEALLKMGFESVVQTEAEVRKVYNPEKGKPIPFIETFTKNTAKGLLTIRLFLGNTGVNHDSKAFHLYLKDSLLNDSVMIYNGHSGIGKNLDLSRIESLRGIKLPLAKDYQILFLGSCVPYAYYTDMFFQKKASTNDPAGTKNLDILAYGNESVFANVDDIRLTEALLKYMEKDKRTSYQDIITNDALYFLSVNGDEDNPIQ